MQTNEFEENVSSCIPPEIWVKLFTYLPRPRNLKTLRLVCKLWKAVTDENFDMKLKINDSKMDVNSIINLRLRFTHCIISKFVKDDILQSSLNPLFWDPEIISSLNLRGNISKPNLLLIASQCQNIKELIIMGSMLVGDTKLFAAESNEETNILSKFMSGIQTLVINALPIEITDNNPTPVNFYSLLNWPMMDLKSLVLRLNFKEPFAELEFLRVLENFRSLEHFEYTSRSCYSRLRVRSLGFVFPYLSTLNIEVRNEERLQDWVTLIRAQRSIKHLKITTVENSFFLDLYVLDAILQNSKSLQSLELKKLSRDIYAHSFSELINLKRLVLCGNGRAMIHYFSVLPDTVKVLVLENVLCKKQDFALITGSGVNITTRNIILYERFSEIQHRFH